jgi:molecular chaperone DnaK
MTMKSRSDFMEWKGGQTMAKMARDNRMLGRFRLEGIPPAPRGVPQVKVSFDIDANGILNVTAREQGTGKEQTVTITDSTSLDKAEVDRMVREAEQHAAEDQARRETVDARHQGDSLAYQLERTLQDLGEKVPPNERARCEQLIADAREAVRDENTTKEHYSRIASDLQQALHMVASAAYQQAGHEAGAYGSGQQGGDEDVIDADFTEG